MEPVPSGYQDTGPEQSIDLAEFWAGWAGEGVAPGWGGAWTAADGRCCWAQAPAARVGRRRRTRPLAAYVWGSVFSPPRGLGSWSTVREG